MKVRIAVVGCGKIAEKSYLPRILDDRPVIPNGEHARHVLEIMEKAMVAARTGKTQRLETTYPGDHE